MQINFICRPAQSFVQECCVANVVVRFIVLVGTLSAFCVASLAFEASAEGESEIPTSVALDPEKVEFFEKRVRPILAEHCYSCHGENPEKIQGGLALNTAAGLLAGGDMGPVIVPGEPAQSRLIEAICYANQDLQMPPEGKLPDNAIVDLEKWIRDGAVDPRSTAMENEASSSPVDVPYDFTAGREHWAYQPMQDHEPPNVADKNWIKQPIDRFVRAEQEERLLIPASPADKRTLIRRATFDLIGLPPTPEEISAYLNDESPDAFTKVVDRLLASPRYGERWARHWLDVARYGDSNGFDENDLYPYSYRYRDYVIKSFNDDKPYDQFVCEQLAGDLMPRPANADSYYQQLIATGFLMIGAKQLAENDTEKRQMDIVDEIVDVTGKAFMGETLGCARCHDHKFDPIPTRDYYAMAGIFNSTQIMPEKYKYTADPVTRPIAPEDDVEAYRVYEDKLADAKKRLRKYEREQDERYLHQWRGDLAKYLVAATEIRDTQACDIREAENFADSNLFVDKNRFGKGIGVLHYISEEFGEPRFVEWEYTAEKAGVYRLELRYAEKGRRSGQRRSGIKLIVNGKVVNESACSVGTGGLTPEWQQWNDQGTFELEAGTNRLRIEASDTMMPPIDQYAVVSADEHGQMAARRNQLIDEYQINALVLDNFVRYFAQHAAIE